MWRCAMKRMRGLCIGHVRFSLPSYVISKCPSHRNLSNEVCGLNKLKHKAIQRRKVAIISIKGPGHSAGLIGTLGVAVS